MYAYKNDIIILVNQLHHFLHFPIHIGFDETAELPHPVIHMHHVITLLKLVQFLERHHHFALSGFIGFQLILMKTVKNLMIGVTYHR